MAKVYTMVVQRCLRSSVMAFVCLGKKKIKNLFLLEFQFNLKYFLCSSITHLNQQSQLYIYIFFFSQRSNRVIKVHNCLGVRLRTQERSERRQFIGKKNIKNKDKSNQGGEQLRDRAKAEDQTKTKRKL